MIHALLSNCTIFVALDPVLCSLVHSHNNLYCDEGKGSPSPRATRAILQRRGSINSRWRRITVYFLGLGLSSVQITLGRVIGGLLWTLGRTALNVRPLRSTLRFLLLFPPSVGSPEEWNRLR